MKEIISVLLLCVPVVWEIIDDRLSDPNKNLDVLLRGFLIIIVSIFSVATTHHHIVGAMALSTAIHFLVFDYAIAYVLGRHDDWFSYLGTTSVVDRNKWWSGLSPKHRLYIRLTVFIIAVLLYIFL